MKVEAVRQWVILIIGVALIIARFVAGNPAHFFAGTTFIGGSSIVAAKARPGDWDAPNAECCVLGR